jgi:hypothetical protein
MASLYRSRILVTALAAAAFFSLQAQVQIKAATSAASATPATAAAKPKASTEEATAAVPNDASQQGIKVHGHWTIDVRNPDGTLAEHREFENSLQDDGFNLANLLAGTITAGEPVISLTSTNESSATSICGVAVCQIIEYTNGARVAFSPCTGSYYCVPNLVATEITTGSGQTGYVYTLKLSGQLTATQAGSITGVGTFWFNCSTSGASLSAVPPSGCASQTNLPANSQIAPDAGNGIPEFTGTSVSQINVSSGQIVQVTVTLSFS